MLAAQRRSRLIRLLLYAAFWCAAVVAVSVFLADMNARPDPIAASSSRGLKLGFFAGVCWLPSLLGLGYTMWALFDLRSGGPDVRFLHRNRDQIIGVQKEVTTYTHRGAALAQTEDVLVRLADGTTVKLTVRRQDVDRVIAQLRVELGIVLSHDPG